MLRKQKILPCRHNVDCLSVFTYFLFRIERDYCAFIKVEFIHCLKETSFLSVFLFLIVDYRTYLHQCDFRVRAIGEVNFKTGSCSVIEDQIRLPSYMPEDNPFGVKVLRKLMHLCLSSVIYSPRCDDCFYKSV